MLENVRKAIPAIFSNVNIALAAHRDPGGFTDAKMAIEHHLMEVSGVLQKLMSGNQIGE